MIELELPCCGATAHLVQLADEIHCDECGVTLDMAADDATEFALAA